MPDTETHVVDKGGLVGEDARELASRTGFVVVGFPKCGTSALIRELAALPGVAAHRGPSGWEAPFFQSDAGVEKWAQTVEPDAVNGHKFASYIFDQKSLRRLHEQAPNALVIVCIRDPLRALVSWRTMHRRLAETGATHFVNRTEESTEFYSTCSLSDYYRAFAGPRLAYAAHIRKLCKVLEDQRILVLAQERLAADGDVVMAQIASELGVGGYQPPAARRPHVGRSDTVDHVDLDPDIRAEIAYYRADLIALRVELRDRATLIW